MITTVCITLCVKVFEYARTWADSAIYVIYVTPTLFKKNIMTFIKTTRMWVFNAIGTPLRFLRKYFPK